MRVVPLQCQGLCSWVVVAIAMALVVVSAWTVTVIWGTVAWPTAGGVLGQAAADMVPFHRRRAMMGRPGRKGALWA